MTKKRILFCNEASFLLTGFGTYGREILNRLVDTGKYEIAEFATYGRVHDARDKDIRWRYYANSVSETDSRFPIYKQNPVHQFGEWRFERVLLDFKPDIVFDIRDYWMLAYQQNSPLRRFFHWVIMPTVDSSPQKEEWIETFIDADGVLTYSEWGGKVLQKEGGGKIKYFGTASPGVDLNVFKPVHSIDKHREEMGFFSDVFIIGTVMRNQIRKLYPDLFQAFRIFHDKYLPINPELVKKTYLYAHTSYPDLGWAIPELIKEHGISHKVICTYVCKQCKRPFCSFWQDAIAICPHCNVPTGLLPNVGEGLNREQLSSIYSLFDAYIQYSICEGFGMPQAEAAACGIPIMAVDYSAMSEIVEQTGGVKLKVQRLFRELVSNSYRALPDNEYCADAIYKFLLQSQEKRQEIGRKARRAAEQYYDWDKTAKKWENYFDSVVLTDDQGKWDTAPANIYSIPESIPPNLDNEQFTNWIITDVLHQPKLLNNFFAMKMMRDLNYGAYIGSGKTERVDRKKMFEVYKTYAENRNLCEAARTGQYELEPTDFIEYANLKDKIRALA